MKHTQRKFWIYYNSQKLSSDFTVEEFGWHDSVPNYTWEETRINYLVQFVVKGVCHLTVWDEKGTPTQYDVQEGQAFVIRQGVRHKYISDEEVACARYWLSFAGERAESMLLRCGITPQTVILNNIPLPDLHKHYRKFYQCIREVDDIAFRLYSITYGVFNMLKDLSADVGETDKRLTDKQVLINTVVRYVENNFALKLETKELAKQFGYERSYLYRLFKKEKGMSLQQYISDTRIKYARSLLVETDKSCVQVASEVGYESYPAFFKIFKDKTGSTPEQYRKVYKRNKN